MTRDEIRTHIEKYGTRRVKITPHLIYKWWKIFNATMFGGKLPIKPDHLDLKDIHCFVKSRKKNKIRERQNLYGYSLSDHKYTLGINILRVHSRQFFLAVLIHEMVHAYIDLYFPKRLSRCHHGQAFWTFKDLVETIGLPFDVHYNDPDVWKKVGRKIPKYELESWYE